MWSWVWIGLARAASPADQAAAALDRGDAAGAAKIYRKLVRSDRTGAVWFQLGLAEHGAERFEDAAAAFAEARAKGHAPAQSALHEARALTRIGEPDRALDALEVAFREGGPGIARQFSTDPELSALSAEPRLKAMLGEADRQAHPCEHDPRYAALDFWVGAFVVTDPAGNRIGENTITREQRGCVLVERWTDGWGGTGTSLTHLDPTTGGWRQLWIDEGGRIAEYEGGLQGPGRLVMEARTLGADGRVGRSRGTWTAEADGTVRQVFEQPTEDGGWRVVFDGRYTRR